MRRPRPPTTSPTNRIVAAAVHGHADTLADGGRERRTKPSAAPRAVPRRGPALGPARHAADRAPGRSTRSAAAAGTVLLAFIVAGVLALILNPVGRRPAAAPAVPARPRRRSPSTSGCCSRSPAPASCWPTRSPTRPRSSAATSRGSSTTPTSACTTCRPTSTTTASTSRSRSRARPRSRPCSEKVVGGTSDIVSLRRRDPDAHRPGRPRPDPRARPVDLHARLRRADRRRRAPGDAARRRHASDDDYPTARPARGLQLRPRAAAVQHRDGHRRGPRPVAVRRRSGSSPTAAPTRWPSGSSSG